ncbi:MAG: tRNA (adenosine(37)-N6)-threonylcarbamoyltransferase complex dimerization subunit type 1 TsaB [Lachnospiraceae bacterium]|nr:tRNA (adenosine(37)-N6)-threonylcarbamoyltransferase complex dimerization subunit type 1 TsaB [Lachnospiraceae bacterium]
MKLIGIDSSGLVAGVAVWQDGVLLAERLVNYKKTHSQTLLPMLAQIREELELDLSAVDAVAVASGPGSFTGLRIGSATAKGLGFVMECPIVEVPTLEGLAYRMWGTRSLICPVMDARREQVYTGIYELAPEEEAVPVPVWEQRAVSVTEAAEKLNALGREVLFLGDGVRVYREKLDDLLQVPHGYAPAHLALQSAGAVASLGAIYLKQGRFVQAADHAPEYLRSSQAERSGPKDFEI